MDLFKKIKSRPNPLGKYFDIAHGYYMFPELEGEISNKMMFRGKENLCWSLNNYLGLANHPVIRKVDTEATKEWGLAYPMGARMMSGQTKYHEKLETDLANFVGKPAGYLLNYGYQGMFSIIDSLVDRNDVIIYDAEAHACIIDGMRIHIGKRFVYPHNDIANLEKSLKRAKKITDRTNGGVLVITEGVYSMTGGVAKLDKIIELRKKYNFRLLVDDAHGFGTMGPTGAGTGEHFGLQDEIDIYFATFAKSMAGIGGFVASTPEIIRYLMYNMRSQVYAKSLPMPMVIGIMKRLEMLKTMPELREKLWTIVRALQNGLKENGFNIGDTQSPVTPVILSGTLSETTGLTRDLRERFNIFCSIISYPVVAKGVILLRLIPTAMHNLDDVKYTIDALKSVKSKLDNGDYKSSEEIVG